MDGGTKLVKVDAALLECSEKYPGFAYPWGDLEAFLDSAGLVSLPLVGYGSLINRESAGRTIDVDGAADRKAVKAFGALRVFNYRMPAKMLEQRYGTPANSKYVAALNCEVSGKTVDQFNGILTHVGRDRLDALRERERAYSLKPVVYHSWDKPEEALSPAYILELLPDGRGGSNPYDTSIFPHQAYTRLCQEGASAVSAEFLSFFNDTCFLADKITRLSNYSLPEHESQALEQ